MPLLLTDNEIAEKLESFSGAITGLDEETSEVVGKLLLDEMKEDMTAGSESYARLYRMIGGFSIIGLLCLATIFF